MDINQEQFTSEDLELLAASQELSEIFKTAGINISSLTDDQILELTKIAAEASTAETGDGSIAAESEQQDAAQQQAALAQQQQQAALAQQQQAQQAQQAQQPGIAAQASVDDQEQMERLAEADFTGRVIARSMLDELEKVGGLIGNTKTASVNDQEIHSINAAVYNWLGTEVEDRMNKVAEIRRITPNEYWV